MIDLYIYVPVDTMFITIKLSQCINIKMMSTIHITDLFYNSKNVDNTCDFILVHSDVGMDNIIFKIGYIDDFSIYDYNIEYIKKILSNSNLNMDNFAFMYQIKTKDIGNIKFIIMANKKITRCIEDYLPIENYEDGSRLWLPKENRNEYSYIGLIYSQKNKLPNYKHHRLINNSFLFKNYNDKIHCIYGENINYIDISKDYVKHRLTEKIFSHSDNYRNNNNITYYDVNNDNINYYDIENGTVGLIESGNPWYENVANVDRVKMIDPIILENKTDIYENKNEYNSFKIISIISIFVIVICVIIKILFFCRTTK